MKEGVQVESGRLWFRRSMRAAGLGIALVMGVATGTETGETIPDAVISYSPSPSPSSAPTPDASPASPSSTPSSSPVPKPSPNSVSLPDFDTKGETVPDTNYKIPDGAVFMSTNGEDDNTGTKSEPVKTLNKAISIAQGGGTIVLRGGVYHDGYTEGPGSYRYKIIGKTLTFQAYPHEQVWLDGTEAQPASKWKRDDAGHWYMDWSTPQFCDGKYYDYRFDQQPTSNQGPCAHFDINSAPEYPAATDPQMVFVDNKPAQEVGSLSDATGGRFYYDWDNRRIYISSDPSSHTVDASVYTNALVMGGSNYAIKGIGVRRYATNEYSNLTGDAIYVGATNTRVENSAFVENAGGGLYLSPQGGVLDHSVMVRNGNTAFGSNGHSESSKDDSLLIENNYVADNNAEHFGMHCTASCGQAGIKLAHMAGFTVRNNIFEGNDGHGFWCDENCSKGVMVDNVARDNKKSGIIYEISSDGIIASNLLIDNGMYGIWLAAATTKVYNNTIITNGAKGALWVYDDDRSRCDLRGTQIGPDTVGVEVVNNVIYDTGGTDSSLRAQAAPNMACGNTAPDQFFTKVDYNAYYRKDDSSKKLVRWLAPGGEVPYVSAKDFNTAKGFDQHSLDIAGGEQDFVNLTGGDYALKSDSDAYRSAAKIPADVAAVIGVKQATGQNRGALVYPGSK